MRTKAQTRNMQEARDAWGKKQVHHVCGGRAGQRKCEQDACNSATTIMQLHLNLGPCVTCLDGECFALGPLVDRETQLLAHAVNHRGMMRLPPYPPQQKSQAVCVPNTCPVVDCEPVFDITQ